MKKLFSIFVVSLAWSGGFTPLSASEIEIQEWTVPWENSRPRDPFVDSEGRVWFVGQRSHYVAYLDVDTGEFTKFDLTPGTGPHNLIVDKAGDVWYAGNRAAHIGRLDPGSGEIAKYPMPDPAARDPHTLVFDGNGDIWFTVQAGNFIGKRTTATGKIQLVSVPTERARPYGIVIDSTNRPWIAELGTNKIATVDPQTMELKEYTLPYENARPRRLQLTSDDQVWYVDWARGSLGNLDPSTGEVKEWVSPAGSGSKPYGMAVDAQDRLWFVETAPDPNQFVGFDPKTREFFSITKVPSGGGTIRHMMFNRPTGEVWFGTDANTVGRARVIP